MSTPECFGEIHFAALREWDREKLGPLCRQGERLGRTDVAGEGAHMIAPVF